MLDNYITTQENLINGKLAKIQELEALIEQLRKEVRLDEQLKQARVTASEELSQWLAKGKALLGDMAGIFPLEFLEDVKSELGSITEEIKENYEKYCDNGDRFLSASGDSDSEIEEPIIPINPENDDNSEDAIEVIVEPSNDDDTDSETVEIKEGNEDAVSALSASELAKRLGFKSHHEVTKAFKNFTKSGFILWSSNHDPDKYGWYKVNGKYQIVA